MIAVTGSAGFIGSNLALTLASAGHELLLVDHPLTPAKGANFAGLAAFRFLEHDAFLTELDAGRVELDAIFHLGACSTTTELDWGYLSRNNVGYSQRLWTWCAASGCPYIYASSAATYGDGSRGFDDRTHPSELVPLNLYGKSKNDFDLWVLGELAAGRPAPPGWAGMKFFNVYGPRESHKGNMASVVRHAFRQIQSTGVVKLFRSTDPSIEDGGQRRDFVFVGDCAAHMLWLWRHPEASGIYNSGTGSARSFAELARATFAAMGREERVEYIDMPPALARQYQNFTQAEMGKLRAAGCDVAVTGLEDGVRRYVGVLGERGGE